MTKVFQNGAVEIVGKYNELFNVNGKQLKHYHWIEDANYYTSLKLEELLVTFP